MSHHTHPVLCSRLNSGLLPMSLHLQPYSAPSYLHIAAVLPCFQITHGAATNMGDTLLNSQLLSTPSLWDLRVLWHHWTEGVTWRRSHVEPLIDSSLFFAYGLFEGLMEPSYVDASHVDASRSLLLSPHSAQSHG